MDARTRLGWVRLYEQLGDAGRVCRRCGISRPTLRKWWRRYETDGVAGLKDESRRPHCLAKQKVFAEQEALVLDLRRSGNQTVSGSLLACRTVPAVTGVWRPHDAYSKVSTLVFSVHARAPPQPGQTKPAGQRAANR